MAAECSYWEKKSFLTGIDLAVIGSGIVGLSAAISLKDILPGLRIAIVERGFLPAGASTRNAGFACFGSLTELADDLERTDEQEVFALVEKRWKGLKRLLRRTGQKAIEYRPTGNYELFRAEDESHYRLVSGRIDYFNDRIARVTGLRKTYVHADEHIGGLGLGQTRHLILNRGEGQLHTGKMMRRLIGIAFRKGIEIFNGLEIADLEDGPSGPVLHTSAGFSLRPSLVLMATNGFTPRFFPDLHMEPARNQVLITEPVPQLKLRGCFHYDRGYVYFRNVGNRVLLGGARNRDPVGERTDHFGTTETIRSALLTILGETVLPGQLPAIDSWWSGIMGVGPVKKPILEKASEHVYLAVRLGGMGVALGSILGEEAAHLIAQRFR